MKILGLHCDYPFIRWAVVELHGKKCELQSLKSVLPEDVKQLYKEQPKDLVATGMTALVRHLDFKISSSKKIEKGLPFQIESLTSLPSDQVVYCSNITPIKGGADVTIFLASKESLVAHLNDWKQLTVIPDLVSSTSQGLLRFTQFRCPNFSSGFIVYLGSKETTCVCFEEGAVKKAFVIDEGVETFISLLGEDLEKALFENEEQSVAKQIDLLHLKAHLNPLFSDKLEQFSKKLSGVLYSLQNSSGQTRVLFTGRTDAFVNTCPFLLKNTPEFELFCPELPLNHDELNSAIAIGLAIEATSKSKNKIQFLQGDFTPSRQWKKAGRNALIFLALSCALSLGLGLYVHKQLGEGKAILVNQLAQIVSQVDSPLASTLYAEGLEFGVAQAMHMLKKYDKEALFLLQAPTVSEVLAWISNNAMFTSLAKQGDPFDLIHLQYHLVSFPKIGHMRDPYQAKVELQFRLKHSMSARNLHEELLRGDHLVDSSQEIIWEPFNDGYQATFYLKNRVPHVR
jgi:hypothetical protein